MGDNINIIPTLVINLERSKDRKLYMGKTLSRFSFLGVSFVRAVDGKALTDEEIAKSFDRNLSFLRYGRELSVNEIGCTLSHYACYRKVLDENLDYALIMEDDITLIHDLGPLQNMLGILKTEEPTVLLLSGDYWFYRLRRLCDGYSLTSVYDAVGAYAYIVNQAAARRILEMNRKISCVADDWTLYRKQGIRLKAIYPYMVDANIGDFESTINQMYFGGKREQMPMLMRIEAYWTAFLKRILLRMGRFVSKKRK